MIDVLADCLARIQNAVQVGHKKVVVYRSNLALNMLKTLQEEKMIGAINDTPGNLEVELLYNEDGSAVISHFTKISRPGQRIYISANEIKPVLNGRGVGIISTPAGVMSTARAKAAGLGGEYLCEVW